MNFLSLLLLCLILPATVLALARDQVTRPRHFFNNDGTGHMNHEHSSRVRAPPEVNCPACLDARLIQHYTVKGCSPVVYGQCKCPSRFKCPVDVPSIKQKILTGRSTNNQNWAPEARAFRLNEDGELAIEDMIDGCRYNGSYFDLGQIVPTKDVCRICVCGYLDDGTVGVDCETQIQCPALRSLGRGGSSRLITREYSGIGQVRRRSSRSGAMVAPVRLACYDFYEHDKCCPRQECVPISVRTGRMLKPRPTCRYNKRTYQLGEKIDLQSILDTEVEFEDISVPTAEDFNITEHADHEAGEQLNRLRRNQFPENFPEEVACLSCICTEQWNNSILQDGSRDKLSADMFLKQMGESCRRKACEMQLDPRFKAGCLPVYKEDQCCPVDYVCPRSRYSSPRVRGLDFGSKLCKFEGRKYAVGARLYQRDHQAAPCVDCECRVPPDFTCLQRKECSRVA